MLRSTMQLKKGSSNQLFLLIITFLLFIFVYLQRGKLIVLFQMAVSQNSRQNFDPVYNLCQ